MATDAELLKALRTRMADVIARVSAYDVPALCTRLGLSKGDKDEAMKSKFRYAHSRLLEVPMARIQPIAKALLEEEPDFNLKELTALMEERGSPQVSKLTRRRIVAVFDGELNRPGIVGGHSA